MEKFENIRFRGEFRDYQQRVLNNAERYLADGKINIVAAPGSGKTVLGLELIRRIGEPCLVFSPTTAIREQWGERFRELFLEDDAQFDALFSTNLRDIKLVNSFTYQALFTAMEKVASRDSDDDSFEDVDIVRQIREKHIGTICLDEAHHLKNEWQKALEKLIEAVGSSVKIVALTATPPYDSQDAEWNRYLNMCGEVDEEIFVPELVARDTLCPHQDYVYFNYPTDEEMASLNEYHGKVDAALEDARYAADFAQLADSLNRNRDYDRLFTSAKGYIAVLILLEHYGFFIEPEIIRILTGKKELPTFTLEHAENAYRFLFSEELMSAEEQDALIAIFRSYHLYNRGRVELVINESLKRTLVSSVGKLESIRSIARNEYASLGMDLRMLVLTDYIKKESVANMTKTEFFSNINIVSIFETLRRTDDRINIGVLSGSLVILPDSVYISGLKHEAKPIEGTRYNIIETSESTHTVVKVVGDLFARGRIQILIGTKSLLGEGWDAPCINSLILASFVGSFVLSNQMRGRAIRIDRNNPDKASNIWHLVTVEPEYIFAENRMEKAKEYLTQDKENLFSYDYDVLKRRFETFMGPNYDTGVIESGIERITYIEPPYTKENFEAINQRMIALAHDRKHLREQWNNEVRENNIHVNVESEIGREKRVPIAGFTNYPAVLRSAFADLAVFGGLVASLTHGYINFASVLLPIFLVCTGVLLFRMIKGVYKLIYHYSPKKSIQSLGNAMVETLIECGYISANASVGVTTGDMNRSVFLWLDGASLREQKLFNTAMKELLSPIENPRYILIRKTRSGNYSYRESYACPTIIGKKKEHVDILANRLQKKIGNLVPVYTRNEYGRDFILRCRRNSYITLNQKMVDSKYRVRSWE